MVLVAIAAIACDKEEPVVPEIKVTTTEFTLPLAGTEDMSYKVEFNANVAWTAALKEAADWCTITPASGAAGDAAVTVIALENTLEQERVVTLVLTAGSAVKELVLTQEALFVPRIVAEDATLPTAGGSVEVPVNATVPFTVAYEADWLTYEAAANKVTFTATQNTDPDPCAVLVTLANAEYDVEAVIEVSQDGTCKLLWAINMADVMNRPAQAAMFSTDEQATAVSIALYDGNVVLSAGDGSEPVKLNKATGEKVGTIATGDFKPYSVRQDDAGNLVMANRLWNRWTAYGNWFRIAYLAPGATEVANVIADVDDEYIGVSLNVCGDVTKDATIIVPHHNGEYANNVMSVFNVAGGAATQTNLTMNGFKGVGWAGGCFGTWPHNVPGVALLDLNNALTASYETNILQQLNLADGLCTDIASLDAAHPDQGGNYAPTGMDVRMINGKPYLAVAMCSFWSGPVFVYIFDVTTQTLVYSWCDAPAMDPKTASDTNYDYMSTSVTLEAAEGGMVVYVADKCSGTIAAKFFTL